MRASALCWLMLDPQAPRGLLVFDARRHASRPGRSRRAQTAQGLSVLA